MGTSTPADDREELLALLSHELRNPLSTITMSATLLARAAGTAAGGDAHRRHTEAILTASQQMTRLLSDFLEVAKLETGRGLSIDPLPHRVGALLDRAVTAATPGLQGRRLETKLHDPNDAFACDGVRVQQLLTHLLTAAVRTGVGPSPLRLEVSRREETLIFSVHDAGGSIDAGKLARVFEPWWSGATHGGAPGLDLSVARAIAEAHGGTLQLQSTSGSGTTFSFTLPAPASSVRAG